MDIPNDPNSRQALFTMTRPGRLVGASLLSADWLRLGDETRRIEEAGVDWLHIDIMDGRFVENFAFSPAMLAAIRSATTGPLPLQAHLMVEEPHRHVARFIEAGASNVTIHVESRGDLAASLGEIRAAGAQAGLALNPDTRFEVEPFLPVIDLLLVMTVYPGVGGQRFIPETMQNVAKAARARRSGGLDLRIQVDGGIDAETAVTAVQSGANFVVSGSYLTRSGNAAAAVQSLRGQHPSPAAR